MTEEQEGNLEMMRYFFELGHPEQLFHAIIYCGEEEISMPDWVWKNFSASANKYLYLRVKTLDEAFGTSRTQEMRFDKLQRRVLLSGPVCKKAERAF